MAEFLRTRNRDQSAFSLVELLVVMLLTGVIGAAILATVASSSRAERQALDMRNNTDHARIAVERIRDVVRAGYGICDGSDATTLTFWAGDESGDERVAPEELVTFELTSDELRRTTGTGAPATVAFGLGPASAFTYFDADGVPVATPVVGEGIDCADASAKVEGPGDIGTIGVTLAGDSADGRIPATLVESQITLRNAAQPDGTISPNRAPVAIINLNCSGHTCTFNGSGSYDEDGSIASHAWSFGDGGTGSGRSATHIYAAADTYEVTLTVTDDRGGTGTAVRFITVGEGNAPPSAGFTVSCDELSCDFDAAPPKSFDSDGTIVSYEWTLGHPDPDPTTMSGPSITYTYPAPGTYSVELTVTDNEGATDSAQVTANPTGMRETVKVTKIEDISTAKSNGSWIPKVRVNLQFADGAPAQGVVVDGKFGPSPEVANDLKSNTTNSLGQVSLQANGDTNNATFFFQVTRIEGFSVHAESQLSITLTRP